MSKFVHLHVHSFYSLLDGTTSLEELLRLARKLKFKHLALTDRLALYGAVAFYKLAKEAGIHPIIGAEVTLNDAKNLVLLAMNNSGYRNLCQLLSMGHLRGGHLKFKLTLKDILRYKIGLFILSGGQEGIIWQLTKQRKIEEAQTWCRKMKSMFGGFFYIELQQYHPNDFLVNLRIRDLAIQHGIPLVATNDVHFQSLGDWPLRQVLHAIDENTLVDKITVAGSPEQYLKSAAEMERLFGKFPGAIENTEKIARQCTFEFSLGKPVFPAIKLPEGETSFSYLWKTAFEGAKQRYRPLTKILINRLSTELNTINELGLSDYFLIVKDIVDFCHSESIPCVGRGSAGDSVVSYVLGITQVDPLRYNLYFERFLNRERTDPPDIDLDICWKNRDRVLEYVYKKYGEDHTAMICTFNTFQLRSTIRDVARAYGFPEDEISTLTKHLPHYSMGQLSQVIHQLPECQGIQDNVEVFKQVLDIARRISDFPRHQSIHAGGVIIAPDKITNYTPLEVAGKGIVVSHYDMYSIDPLGLVKMDLLGVRSLSIVTDCLRSVSSQYLGLNDKNQDTVFVEEKTEERVVDADDSPALFGEDEIKGIRGLKNVSEKNVSKLIYRYDVHKQKVTPENAPKYLSPKKFAFLDSQKKHLSPLDLRVIPENDSNVIALLCSGLSLGCFQTESPAMRGLLKKMQIDGVDDVIVAVAVIRPGAADSGMKEIYIQRRGGLLEVEYAHPALKPVLEETYGCIIYQEQVMQVAAEVAGFSLAQGDVLRKAMTKSRNRKTVLSMHDQFIEGVKKNGIAKTQAENIWRFLANFVGYGFNKAHSATYGVIAYQTAYLKYYFPVQYMTAVLNNHGGFYSKAAYIEECRRMGIRLLVPDVNESKREFTCRDNAIRVGLDVVFELTEKTKDRILVEQRKGRFREYYDFMQRVHPREAETANLIKCGALRSLDINEPRMLLQNKLYFRHNHNRNLTEALLQNVKLMPYNKYQRVLNEMEILDFGVTDHPLMLYEDKIDWQQITPSFKLEECKGQGIKIVGWTVATRRVATKNKEYMKFLTLEDRYGLYEAVMFPRVYAKYGHLSQEYGPFLITGTVQSRLPGEANLLVDELEVIKLEKGELEGKLQEM
jgi:DNA polymerase III alpha subunit